MKKFIILSALIALLSGCAISQKVGLLEEKPKLAKNEMVKELDSIPPPSKGRLTVAVYQFADKTGQRKATPGIASFSTAVTQGGDALLIRALQDVGRGTWFDVVERGNIDALTKERLIIAQMRQAYEGQNAQKLMPLQFAGMIIEGGIIGYDSGLESGGIGYNFLGIGPTTQYSKDVITISLRAVSVNTGKILATVTITKIVLSTSDSIAIFKSIDPGGLSSIINQVGAANTGSQSAIAGIFQFESGITINEATTIALKAAIESAVVELVKEGERKGIWEYKYPMPPEKPWYDFGSNEVGPTSKDASLVDVKNVDPKKTPLNATEPTIPLGNSTKNRVPEDQAAKEGVAPANQ
jgi:curli production assembly/transport component CsgG